MNWSPPSLPPAPEAHVPVGDGVSRATAHSWAVNHPMIFVCLSQQLYLKIQLNLWCIQKSNKE